MTDFSGSTVMAFLAPSVLLLVACGQSGPSENTSGTEPHSEEIREITIALDWLAQPSNAGGIVAAQELGYYEDAGLEVNIQPGGTEATSIQVVAGGGAEFGQETSGQILLGREQGIGIVCLMPSLQERPAAYLYHQGQVIDSPADFNGRTVYTQVSSPDWEWTVEEYGLDEVEAVQFSGSYASFVMDETAVAQGYLTNAPAQLAEQGVDVEVLPNPTNVDYGTCLFTTEELIDENPELVSDVVEATVRGWEYYEDNIEDVAEWIAPLAEDQTVEELIEESEALRPFVWTGDAEEVQFGWQTEERWNESLRLALEMDIIEDEEVAEGAWTTEFLPED
ncbi:ABC transporter substrate-binding protein [Nesterenkonia ebinurensis]|uniref:ABC transporter substrate-binding protein n=1 Tax=Nesterenkonia ebinurensis TaxID=2608252 RepID=UPI00123E13B1|nr:ABC transporter substrate-binding protein [Nesterenkonia ebinurensis]